MRWADFADALRRCEEVVVAMSHRSVCHRVLQSVIIPASVWLRCLLGGGLLLWSMGASALSLQDSLAEHLQNDVAYWLDEPRVLALLRDDKRVDAGWDAPTLAAMEARWRTEMAGDGGELTDRIAARFASKYLAEVALRLDGAYGPLLLLDKRGVVVAASELPDDMNQSSDRCLQLLDAHPDRPWVQDHRPTTGHWTHVAWPVTDGEGVRLGTLVFDIDVSRLPQGSIAGIDSRRPGNDRVGAALIDEPTQVQ